MWDCGSGFFFFFQKTNTMLPLYLQLNPPCTWDLSINLWIGVAADVCFIVNVFTWLLILFLANEMSCTFALAIVIVKVIIAWVTSISSYDWNSSEGIVEWALCHSAWLSLYLVQGLVTKERKSLDPAAVPFAKHPEEIEGLCEGAQLVEVVILSCFRTISYCVNSAPLINTKI